MRAMPREVSLIASRVFPLRRLRGFESTLQLGSGSSSIVNQSLKGDPSSSGFAIFRFWYGMRKKKARSKGMGRKCPGACVTRSRRKCPVRTCTPSQGFKRPAHHLLGCGGRFRKSGTSSGFRGSTKKGKPIMLCTYCHF